MSIENDIKQTSPLTRGIAMVSEWGGGVGNDAWPCQVQVKNQQAKLVNNNFLVLTSEHINALYHFCCNHPNTHCPPPKMS